MSKTASKTAMKITSATGGLLGAILYSFENVALGTTAGRQGLCTFYRCLNIDEG
jgi:hypothetical protein